MVAPHEQTHPLIEIVVVYPAERRRRKAIKPRRETPRRSGRVRDPAFAAFVHTMQRWCRRTLPGHRCPRDLGGVSEADHMGERPTGRKADDDTQVHLCKQIHVARDAKVGREWREGGEFWDTERGAPWTREQMRAWMERGIADARAAYARHRDAVDEIPF